jgi:hypothetical protein
MFKKSLSNSGKTCVYVLFEKLNYGKWLVFFMLNKVEAI